MNFSFIIPVYNVEQYLDECITSIMRQDYSDFEVILIDDGSTDSSGNICDNWAEKETRIRVVHQGNMGLSAARNLGIDLAKGEYIVFLDSDDYWLSDGLLKKIYLRLHRTKSDVISLNYRKIYTNHAEKIYFSQACEMPPNLKGKESLEFLISQDLWIACAWNKIIRRSLFEQYPLYFVTGVTAEDIDWCVRLALYAKQFDFLDIPVIGYRQRAKSISKHMTIQKVECLIDNIERSKEILQNNEYENMLLMPYMAYQTGTLLFNIALLDQKADRKRMIYKTGSLIRLLRYSKNKRMLFLNWSVKLVGVQNTIFLLRLKNKMTE